MSVAENTLTQVMGLWVNLNGIMYLNGKLVEEHDRPDCDANTYAAAMYAVDDYARKLIKEMGEELNSIV